MARPSRLLAALGPDPHGPTDTDLLTRFAANKDAGAFELLVYRHAALVLRVCRTVLRDRHAAEDAAQAVFLALARQARSVRGETLPGWLFRVGRRVATRAARRRPPSADVVDLSGLPAPETPPSPDAAEVLLLHEEVAHLPEAYRAPVLLFYFEGLTRAETASRLGLPDGTVAGRLARAKERLATRLARRGVTPAVLVMAFEVAPPSFAGTVARAAVAYTEGRAEGVPASVLDLVTQEERRGAMAKMLGLIGGGLACGAVALGLNAAPVGGPSTPPSPASAVRSAVPVADLPDGAVIRLGSAALRHPDALEHLRFTPDGRHLLSYGRGKLRRWDAKSGAAVPDPAKDIALTFGTTPAKDIGRTFGTTLLGPDATRVVASHLDLNPTRVSVRAYDLATGRHAELFAVPDRGPDARIGWQRFVLSPDGTLLVEGWAREAFVWDLRAKAVRHRLTFPGGQTSEYHFTPDGKHLLTAGRQDPAVRFWDMATGKEALALTRERRGQPGVSGLAVSTDGRWLAAADDAHHVGEGTEVAVWDLAVAGPPRVVTAADGASDGMAFGPGGALYVVSQPPVGGTARMAAVVTRWDAASGRQVGRWAGPHLGGAWQRIAAISPDGGTMAVGSYWGVVRLYDTRTGAEVASSPALTAPVIGAGFDPAGTHVRAVGADGSTAAWDAATGAVRSRRDVPPALSPVEAGAPVVASPDGRWAVTCAKNPDGQSPPFRADLWDLANGERRHAWGVDGWVKALVPVPGGSLLAGLVEVPGGVDALVWDTATGKAMPGLGALLDSVRSRYAVSPDGATFWVVDEEKATGYDPATGRNRVSWKLADHDILGRPVPTTDRRPGLVRAVAVSPDGKALAVAVLGSVNGDVAKRGDNLVLVEAATGKVIRRSGTVEVAPEWLVSSADGRWVAGDSGVWDVATLREVRRFPASPRVTAVGFSPDGKRVATGHTNGTALVWPVGSD